MPTIIRMPMLLLLLSVHHPSMWGSSCHIFFILFLQKRTKATEGLPNVTWLIKVRIQIQCKFIDYRFIVLPIGQWGYEVCFSDIAFIRQCDGVIEAWVLK